MFNSNVIFLKLCRGENKSFKVFSPLCRRLMHRISVKETVPQKNYMLSVDASPNSPDVCTAYSIGYAGCL